MKTVKIEISVKVPADATEQHIREWVRFVTGYCGQISMSNPLHDQSLEAESIGIN